MRNPLQRQKKGKAQIWMLSPNVQARAGFPRTHTHKTDGDSNASKVFCGPAWYQLCKVKRTASLLFLLNVAGAQWRLKGIVLYFEAYIKGSLITGMISVSSATRNPELELM